MIKSLPTLFLHYLKSRTSRRNLLVLGRFLTVLVVMVGLYSVIFHFLMAREGKDYSWITGVYWTLTVMSTLGFGDITFHTDAGRIFSLVVLLSGIVFLLVLLPFTFIEFFYEPWMAAQAAARVPRRVDRDMTDHVILIRYGPIATALIEKLTQYHYPYVVVLPEQEEVLRLHDQGLSVIVGDLDDPETYRRARVGQAALVAATRSDVTNTSVAFTVREVAPNVPIVGTARDADAIEILKLAGCTRVLGLAETLGGALARRTRSGDAAVHVIGRLDDVLVAEVNAAETPLVGTTLQDGNVRNTAGVTVVGAWRRGRFENARPETIVDNDTVLVLAGSGRQLEQFDQLCRRIPGATAPVIIIGGGRVGRATARALDRRNITWRIVERHRERIRDPETYILGSAADPATMEKAGIKETPAVVVTTHDDDTNIYLTLYCRRLRPDMQIISRATLERNVPTLHRAGADFVISSATMGANILFNLLKRSDVLMVAEGLNVFKVKVPPELAGRTIAETSIRRDTGCSIVGVDADGTTTVNPDPNMTLPAEAELVLIGTVEAENRFLGMHAEE